MHGWVSFPTTSGLQGVSREPEAARLGQEVATGLWEKKGTAKMSPKCLPRGGRLRVLLQLDVLPK